MYTKKGAGPRMKPWGTPALTTWSHLLLTKEEIRPNIWPTYKTYVYNEDQHSRPYQET